MAPGRGEVEAGRRGAPRLARVTAPSSLVCCGLATLDVVQRVDRVPGADEKVVARGLDVTFGGPAANAAATAAALGVSAVLVTALGQGPVARLVREGLAGAGVRVVDLAGPGAGDPPVSTVLVTRGTGRRAVVSTNATLRADDLGPGAARAAAELLDVAGAVLVDGHHLAAGVAVAEAARRRGVPVLADGGSWKPGLERLLALVDVAILSADFVVPGAIGVRGTPGERVADPERAGGLIADPERAGGLIADPERARGLIADPERAGGLIADPERAGGLIADPERPGRRTGPRAVDDLLDAVAALGPSFVARSSGAGPVRVRLPSGAYDEVVPLLVPPGQVVDTLGAGDVLHGAVGAALARGMDASVALWEGIELATESVRHAGALGWVGHHPR